MKRKLTRKHIPLDRSQMPVIGKADIIGVMEKLQPTCDVANAKYALIGGALFTMLGMDVETRDIDVASDMNIDGFGGLWPDRRAANTSSKLAGHYLIGGICVDWMTEGAKGSAPLFDAAVRLAYLEDGVWLAPLEFAMAIRLYAGRDKDVVLFDRLAEDGVIDAGLVISIIEHYCPEWRGYG